MNKDKLIKAIKVFAASVTEALEDEKPFTVHKNTVAYVAKPKDVLFRRTVVAYADKHGSEKAAIKFGLRKMQVAAYKAHMTMGTYSKFAT